MNITEANHLNNLLRFVLNGTQGRDGDGMGAVDPEGALGSARYLADRAHKALHAGWTGETLALAWPGNRVYLAEELAMMVDDDYLDADWEPDPPPAELNATGKAALG